MPAGLTPRFPVDYVIHRVASAYSRPFMDVAREPFALTLFCFLLISEHERINGLLTKFRDLNVAGLQAVAFHEPKKLQDASRDLQREAGMLEDPSAARARGEAMLAELAGVEWREA